ncbi:PIN domain-containing protein [Sphingomonas daechungensis]|uniref:PIN domain-containing protein n=1 Tax=Sphingomonas daechungensis TaxID=1176646 RepID=UPI003782DB94
MHLLDTGVVWALRGHDSAQPDEQLLEWVSGQMPSTLYVSVVSLLEFENGTRSMERKDKLSSAAIREWIDTRFRPAFSGRIIPIDEAVVRRWSHMGYSDFRDGILAATALEHGLVIATREPGNFRTGKVKTINPWTYTPDADDLDWRRASRSAPIWLKSLFVRA